MRKVVPSGFRRMASRMMPLVVSISAVMMGIFWRWARTAADRHHWKAFWLDGFTALEKPRSG